MLALAVAAAFAASPQCTVTGPAAKAEQALERQIRQRRGYGFRSDRAYAQAGRAGLDPARA